MKKINGMLIAMMILLAGSSAMAIPITSLYNTGLAAQGTMDPHWMIDGSPAYVTGTGFPFGYWMADNSTSKWISPQSSYYTPGQAYGSDPVGTYMYSLDFELPGGSNPVGSWFTMRFAVDNQVQEVYLNGHPLGIIYIDGNSSTSSSYNKFSETYLVDDYLAMTNTLTFQVLNASGATGNPTGLRVEFVDSKAVPEPASLILLGSGLLGAAFLARRRK